MWHVLMCCSIFAKSQQRPHYTQYILKQLYTEPGAQRDRKLYGCKDQRPRPVG